jgi:hypothetical protein
MCDSSAGHTGAKKSSALSPSKSIRRATAATRAACERVRRTAASFSASAATLRGAGARGPLRNSRTRRTVSTVPGGKLAFTAESVAWSRAAWYTAKACSRRSEARKANAVSRIKRKEMNASAMPCAASCARASEILA